MAPPVVALGLFGTGLIATAHMKQLAKQTPYLLEQLRVDVRVVAVSNSRKMLLSSSALQGTEWRTALDSPQAHAADPGALAAHVAAHPGAAAGVLLDCTASELLPQHYCSWLGQQGLHIITPNKKLGAGPLQRYQQLRQLQRETGKHFMYETTVGAGLPIISTLKDLIETGDRVLSIEGILSGTLSFIFNSFRPGMAFSEVVRQAKEQGYTEPDPREDLSGMDVARKVVILARECGLQLSLEDLAVASLVPQQLAQLPTPAEYMAALPQFDGEMAAQAEEAAASGEVLRYVGKVDVAAGTASVTTSRYPASHPFAALQGSDNIVVFTTERYGAATPLIVRGPGAGAEVTAAGVFSDLLQVLRGCAGART
ncbi:homoserine dehydrogenase [Scenedesmus sp. NREL 46B-D3]|nr:homoserine dehydrogenase [Scenedesmus sp. NREL 46B-D3]